MLFEIFNINNIKNIYPLLTHYFLVPGLMLDLITHWKSYLKKKIYEVAWLSPFEPKREKELLQNQTVSWRATIHKQVCLIPKYMLPPLPLPREVNIHIFQTSVEETFLKLAAFPIRLKSSHISNSLLSFQECLLWVWLNPTQLPSPSAKQYIFFL